MAQLPPKVPNSTPSWPDFSHQKFPPMGVMGAPPHNANSTATTAATATSQNPSWVDEFLDFSSTRRGTHRRSMSDSIAFLEAPSLLEECRGTAAPVGLGSGAGHNNGSDFDKFDDDQFMSMFNDDISNAMAAPSSSNPSSPSDHNSINDEKEATLLQADNKQQQQQQVRNETDEVQSLSEWETQNTAPSAANTAATADRIVDPKRVKR